MKYTHIKKSPGIYCIRHESGKVYIGKSINCWKRIKDHIGRLNGFSKDENLHLCRAWTKYGRDTFEVFVLEYLEKDEALLAKRELHWIKELKAIETGYNLRLDTDTKCIITEETRKRLSEVQIKRRKRMTDEELEQEKERSKKFWEKNPKIKERVADKCSKVNSKHVFIQKTKEGEVVATYDSLREILKANPTFKRPTITNAAWGYKPTAYSYVWEKQEKI